MIDHMEDCKNGNHTEEIISYETTNEYGYEITAYDRLPNCAHCGKEI